MNSSEFPFKKHFIYLNFCGVSPLFEKARQKKEEFEKKHAELGTLLFLEYPDILERFHKSAAKLFHTSSNHISFVKNTAEGLSLIANGYPFESPNDEIISFIHEYPSNHYPWVLQQRKNRAKLKLIPNNISLASNWNQKDYVVGFSIKDIEPLVTKNTKIISISHVQFTSGFAANLEEIGRFCKEHQIDFIIDAAQSLGVLPVYPEKYHISAIASSGWKWLLGPIGSGILYTSPEFRNKIDNVMVGADVMMQGQDYLNHTWQPYTDGRKFEYSTTPLADAIALSTCIEELIIPYGIENIQKKIQSLIDIFKEVCRKNQILFLELPEENRSGILSLIVEKPEIIAKQLRKEKVICTVRGGYLRIAPHFMITEEEIVRSAEILIRILRGNNI